MSAKLLSLETIPEPQRYKTEPLTPLNFPYSLKLLFFESNVPNMLPAALDAHTMLPAALDAHTIQPAAPDAHILLPAAPDAHILLPAVPDENFMWCSSEVFMCDLCPKTFSQNCALGGHKAKAHPG